MKKIILLGALCAWLGACSDPAAEKAPGKDPAPQGTRTAVTFVSPQDQHDISVLVFRKDGTAYVFDRLIDDNWTENDGRQEQSVELALGYYKFLFAAGFGNTLSLSPVPVEGQTGIGEVSFSLAKDTDGVTYLPSDELFLQSTEEDRDKSYFITGPSTVNATLKRAVSKVSLEIKQGYIEEGEEIVIPFESGNILDDVEKISVTMKNTGRSVSLTGGEKGADIRFEVAATAIQPDPETGFATLESPFIIPVGKDHSIDIDVIITHTAESSKAPIKGSVSGIIAPNRQLNVRLYTYNTFPEVQITVETAPIDDESEGDSGLWN